jgi:hypothetical protein
MRVLMPLLALFTIVAPSAIARDSQEGIPNHLVPCSQFVIRNPDPGTSFNMRNCCAFGDPWIAANHMSNCCLSGSLRDCSDRIR